MIPQTGRKTSTARIKPAYQPADFAISEVITRIQQLPYVQQLGYEVISVNEADFVSAINRDIKSLRGCLVTVEAYDIEGDFPAVTMHINVTVLEHIAENRIRNQWASAQDVAFAILQELDQRYYRFFRMTCDLAAPNIARAVVDLQTMAGKTVPATEEPPEEPEAEPEPVADAPPNGE